MLSPHVEHNPLGYNHLKNIPMNLSPTLIYLVWLTIISPPTYSGEPTTRCLRAVGVLL